MKLREIILQQVKLLVKKIQNQKEILHSESRVSINVEIKLYMKIIKNHQK